MRRSTRILLVVVLWGSFLFLASALGSASGEESAFPLLAVEAEGPQLMSAAQPSTEAPAEKGPSLQSGPSAEAGADAAPKAKPDAKPQAEPGPGDEPKADAKPKLSKEMTELRDRLRQSLAACYALPVNTRDNTPSEIMDFCLAFGCYAEVTDATSNRKINGVGALCWNYPCAGYQLFVLDGNAFLPRIGYGVQRQPGEMLAFLAMSMVNPDYEIRVGSRRGTVEDLVAHEKRTCRSGSGLPFKLIGLSYYGADEDTWKNERDETWSLERLVREELARSPDVSSSDVVDRLMGLSFAIERRVKRGRSVDGVYGKAQEHVDEYQQFALDLANVDGTWNSQYFALKGASSDFTAGLQATGRILEWLAFSLPAERLQEPKVLKSVGYVTEVLGRQAPTWRLGSLTPRDIDAVMHAVQAISTYDQRVFRPLDPATPPAADKKTARATPSAPTKPNRYTANPSVTRR